MASRIKREQQEKFHRSNKTILDMLVGYEQLCIRSMLRIVLKNKTNHARLVAKFQNTTRHVLFFLIFEEHQQEK